ncbi:TetR/AcrR family transcriptional regulator [Nonomuraea dietziae]
MITASWGPCADRGHAQRFAEARGADAAQPYQVRMGGGELVELAVHLVHGRERGVVGDPVHVLVDIHARKDNLDYSNNLDYRGADLEQGDPNAMRLTRAESKAANRRALIDAAREVVGREGANAKLEDIAELAGLTTGAVYSLFGGKSGLMVAMIDDYTGPLDLGPVEEIAPGRPLEEVVVTIARQYWRMSADPEAATLLLFEIRVMDLVLNDAELLTKLNTAINASQAQLAEHLAGREHAGVPVTREQAVRLARALKAMLSGLGQAVVLGVHGSSEEYFADVARALITPGVLGPA